MNDLEPGRQLDVDKLRRARKDAGYTQIELSRALSRGDNFVTRIENRTREITLVDYLAVCQLLDLKFDACL